MYILKKNTYILHKNMYIFLQKELGLQSPYYDYIFLWGPSRSDLRHSSYLKMYFGTPPTSLRKIRIFLTKILTFFARGTRTSITLIINIPLGTKRKWFEVFPHLKMGIETPCISIKKCKYILKKNKYIIHKNMCISFKRKQDCNHPYSDLYIPLETLGKWFWRVPPPRHRLWYPIYIF